MRRKRSRRLVPCLVSRLLTIDRMRIKSLMLTCVCVLARCSATEVSAQTVHANATAEQDVKRPAFTDRRFDEDWSTLRGVDLSQTGDLWDRVKFMPLDADEHVWLTLAGQVRGRGEYFHEFQFGDSSPEQSNVYGLSRVRVSLDLHASEHFRVFVEGKSSLAANRRLTGGDNASFVDKADLQNGFVDVMVPLGDAGKLTLRGGRQELLFGVQRLVGPSDWTNIRRTFQGVSAIADIGTWTITPFWTELVIAATDTLNHASPGTKLWGVYAVGAVPKTKTVKSDLYWLDADNATATFNGTSGRERRHTLGGRLWRAPGAPGGGATGSTDFDLEVAGQFGTLGGEDIRAWMISANAGHRFAVPLAPRLFAGLDIASGDATPGGRVGTFNQLFPTNHTYFGTMDYIGRPNTLSPNIGITLQPDSRKRLTIVATQFLFWRSSVHDALYNNSGGVFRAGIGTTARYVGAETDLLATYHFNRHLLGYASYNHFVPGAFIRATGPAQGSDYAYAAAQFTF
jgi:hypothetical protein